jgi:large subunit ribosomal protein L32e
MEKKRQTNFQRTKFYAYVKLGSRQKSMRKYKRSGGRHNKTRQKWRSRPPMVEIGYKNQCSTRGLINEKTPIFVNNMKDLDKVGKENIIILGKIGNKLKLELVKKIQEKKMEIFNLNVTKYLKEQERQAKKNKTEKKKA